MSINGKCLSPKKIAIVQISMNCNLPFANEKIQHEDKFPATLPFEGTDIGIASSSINL